MATVGLISKDWASPLPRMEKAWAFALGVLTSLTILGVFASGSMMAAASPSIVVSLSTLRFVCGATLPVPWLIRGTNLREAIPV